MKRLTLIAAALASAPLAHAAPLVDVYAGGYLWNPDTSGSIAADGGNISLDHDLGFDDSSQGVLYVGVEHAVPILPNVRLRYMDLDDDGSRTLRRNIDFKGTTFTAGDRVSADYDIKMLDGTFYWSPLDNVVKLDVGLTVRQLDASFKIRGGGQSASESAHQTFPLGYLAAEAALPFTGFYVGGEVNAIKYDGSRMTDYTARVGWRSDYLVGVELGYSQLKMELDDVGGLDSDLKIGGPYLAATVSF